MRLFVAAVPPQDRVDSLAAALADVRAQSAPEVRWIPVERWHVTLAFLGDVPDDRAAALMESLAAGLAGVGPATVHIAGGGSFSGRVLWAGLAGELDALSAAARAARRAARAARVPVEHRPFQAHLTVARTRGMADLRRPVEVLQGFVGRPWQVAEAVLVRSHLGPAPRHEPIAALPFAPAAGA